MFYHKMGGGVLDLVNFGCFVPSRSQCFHCNAMRKAIKACMNLHAIQQIEDTPGGMFSCYWPQMGCPAKDTRVSLMGGVLDLLNCVQIHACLDCFSRSFTMAALRPDR